MTVFSGQRAFPGKGIVSWTLALAVLGACTSNGGKARVPEAVSQPPLAKVDLCLRDGQGRLAVRAEQATTPEQHRIGLMGRSRLSDRGGMLFWYKRERSANDSFWMHNTLVPLDIAYFGPDGKVLAIQSMTPCVDENAGNCRVYRAGVPFWSALEVNAGLFEQYGIGVGAVMSEAPPGVCQAPLE